MALYTSQISGSHITASSVQLINVGNGMMMSITSASNQILYISSSGNVGIGTNSPLSNLHIISSHSVASSTLKLSMADSYSYRVDLSANYDDISSLTLRLTGQNILVGGRNPARTSLYVFNSGGTPAEAITAFSDTKNIGIYNPSPNSKLHISGSTASEGLLNIQNSSGTNIMYISSSGNIGIGTSNPISKLDNRGDIVTSGSLLIWGGRRLVIDKTTTGVSMGGGYFEFNNSAGGITIGMTDNYDSNHIIFKTRPTDNIERERMRISSGGNVGIGTINPLTPLHVSGSATISRNGGGATLTLGAETTNYATSSVIEMLEQTGVTWGSNAYGFRFFMDGLNNLLHIESSADLNTDKIMTFTRDTRNIGIGTTSPSQRLDISGSVIIRPSGTTDTISFLNLGSAQSRLVTTSNFAIWPSGSEAMRLLSTGQIGIGTGVPIAKLHISSSVASEGILHIQNSSSNSVLYVSSSGNIGIGTSNPTNKIEIIGDTGGLYGITISGGMNGRRIDLTTSELKFRTTTNGAGWAMQVAAYKATNNDLLTSIAGAYGSSVDQLTYAYYGGDGYDSAAMVIVSSSKYIGMGTTTPSNKLDVVGTVEATQFLIPSYNSVLDTNRLVLYNARIISGDTNANLSFISGSSTQVYISSSGNVGIGTNIPNTKLTILSGGTLVTPNADVNLLVQSNANTGNNARINIVAGNAGESILEFGDADDTDVGAVQYRHSNNLLSFRTNGSNDRMVINSGGNVGIGTTSPSSKLHISGSVASEGLLNIQNSTGTNVMYVSSSGVIGLGPGQGIQFLPDYTMRWGGSTPYGSLTWDTGKAVVRATTGNYLSLGASNNSDYLVIATNGNIGIGTSSPSQKLEVVGTILITGSNSTLSINRNSNANVNQLSISAGTASISVFQINTDITNNIVALDARNSQNLHFQINDSTRMVLSSGGNVGIGTSSPLAKLSIDGSGSKTVEIGYSVSLNGNYIESIDRGSGQAVDMIYYLGSSGNKSHRFYTNASEKARIDHNGNVGIGTTSPTAKLHVSGNVLIQGDITIAGSSSIQYITSSHLIVEDNIITVNAFSPFERYAGLEAIDSGSNVTASLLWDGTQDYWFMVSSSNQTSKLIGTTFGTLGSEVSLTNGYIPRATSQNTIANSIIYADLTKIGINSSAPYGTLTIKGDGNGTASVNSQIHIENTSSAVSSNVAARITFNADSGVSYFGFIESRRDGQDSFAIGTKNSANGPMLLITSGSTRIFINGSSGDVGVGTISPSTKLDVVGSIKAQSIEVSSSALAVNMSTNGSYIGWNGSNTSIYGNASGNFGIRTGDSTTRLFISSSGLIGIGTTAPSADVEIYKSRNAPVTFHVINTTNDTSARTEIRVGGSGTAINLTSVPSNYTFLSNWASRGILSTDSGVTNGILLTTTTGPIAFRPGNISAADTMVITGSNVGIGTTSPAYKLDVTDVSRVSGLIVNGYSSATTVGVNNGDVYVQTPSSNSNIYLRPDRSSNTGIFHLNTTGASIGKLTPNARLDVNGNIIATGSVTVTTQFNSQRSTDGWLLQQSGSNRGLYFYTSSVARWAFFDGGSVKAYIDINGHISATAFTGSAFTANTFVTANDSKGLVSVSMTEGSGSYEPDLYLAYDVSSNAFFATTVIDGGTF